MNGDSLLGDKTMHRNCFIPHALGAQRFVIVKGYFKRDSYWKAGAKTSFKFINTHKPTHLCN